ncbi:hypothetical protein ACFP2F_04660 [Hymenobacter artigasi]|uniref:Lipoprotein n=1 Tax=Hymenobacter artigasi TaxID=2719616 RepID=A0ABX1HF98_9BACT|nr:hypothetical protein [Hymenobacter artigasi]NKI88899.1 hypothetical protein [Hymenobacter artigasi]
MRRFTQSLCLAGAIAISGLLLGCPATKEPTENQTPAAGTSATYPAAEGFDQAGSDPKAVALADTVMRKMGGYDAWNNTRYLAWSFFGGQYQIWDKQTGDFHWEKDSLVANYNLGTKQGHVYRLGKDISATPAGQELLGKLTPIWNNNSWWLLMPFKLKDSGVTLKYKGAAKTMAGQPAEALQLTFKNVGTTPENGYEVLVNPTTGLVDEWAYFPAAADAQPAFRRRWADYTRHGQILLAADRSDATKPTRLDNIATAQTLPEGVMSSPTPVTKLR